MDGVRDHTVFIEPEEALLVLPVVLEDHLGLGPHSIESRGLSDVA